MATDRNLLVLRAAWDYQKHSGTPINYEDLRTRIGWNGLDADAALALVLHALSDEGLIEIEGQGSDLTAHRFRVTWWGSDAAGEPS